MENERYYKTIEIEKVKKVLTTSRMELNSLVSELHASDIRPSTLTEETYPKNDTSRSQNRSNNQQNCGK